MRITINVPDEIHREWKALAAKEGTTMRQIALNGIREVLKTRTQDYLATQDPPNEASVSQSLASSAPATTRSDKVQ